MGSNRILTSRGRFVRRQVREAGVHNHKNILVKNGKRSKETTAQKSTDASLELI
jgi:hypothetical protein